MMDGRLYQTCPIHRYMSQRHRRALKMEEVEHLHRAALLERFETQSFRLVVNLDRYWIDLHIL
jgi:hypothetical protein